MLTGILIILAFDNRYYGILKNYLESNSITRNQPIMLIQIKRQECLTKYPKFPQRWYDEEADEIENTFPQVVNSPILILSSKTFKGHSKALGIELTELITAMGIDNLIFLGDYTNAWLYQESDYKPVKEAIQFLRDHKVGKRFNGALRVYKEDLPEFIKHLSWLSRCNAALPYFYFMDAGQNLLGFICKYGNLHLHAVNKETDELLQEQVAKTKFSYLTNKMCYEQFSSSGAIKGRQIPL